MTGNNLRGAELLTCVSVADAAPTRTAVGPAAVWEPSPSRDYGTSGEFVLLPAGTQAWDRRSFYGLYQDDITRISSEPLVLCLDANLILGPAYSLSQQLWFTCYGCQPNIWRCSKCQILIIYSVFSCILHSDTDSLHVCEHSWQDPSKICKKCHEKS